jgi:hypothetical protein
MTGFSDWFSSSHYTVIFPGLEGFWYNGTSIYTVFSMASDGGKIKTTLAHVTEVGVLKFSAPRARGQVWSI